MILFERKKDYLVCVDSDGCAMDTMDIKHIRCFGPCMVAEWRLESWKDDILARWNEINLYTMTRGINRFRGLSVMLQEIDRDICPIDGLDQFVKWADECPELSNAALEAAIRSASDSWTGEQPAARSEGSEACRISCMKKALAWSRAVNQSVARLPEADLQPFPGVREALRQAHVYADVAVVSSANREAVIEEWDRHGLLEHTDLVMAQDAGSKASCIGELLEKGYDRTHVLMCGDSEGDLRAARENDVFFYPILVRHEKESWEEFRTTALARLTMGSYGGGYQQEKTEKFLSNLGGR